MRRTLIVVLALAGLASACSSSTSKPTPTQVGANDAAVCAAIARGDANVPDATLAGASLALRQSITSKDAAMVATICRVEGVSVPTSIAQSVTSTTAPPAGTATTARPTVTTAAPAPVTTAAPTHPAGATALCKDGSYSYSATHSGSCSNHGGVSVFYQ